jgi:hypothetical protein
MSFRVKKRTLEQRPKVMFWSKYGVVEPYLSNGSVRSAGEVAPIITVIT